MHGRMVSMYGWICKRGGVICMYEVEAEAELMLLHGPPLQTNARVIFLTNFLNCVKFWRIPTIHTHVHTYNIIYMTQFGYLLNDRVPDNDFDTLQTHCYIIYQFAEIKSLTAIKEY